MVYVRHYWPNFYVIRVHHDTQEFFDMCSWCVENIGVVGVDWDTFTVQCGYQFTFVNPSKKMQFVLRWT